jgi:hypothetical protein
MGGGGMAIAGGGMGIIILLIGAVLGVDLSALNQVVPDSGSSGTGDILEHCQSGDDANQSADCRVVGFVNSIQAYWEGEFAAAGQSYPEATTVLFSGATQTGCGAANSQVGPFYCPGDQQVYIDLDFFAELTNRLGASNGPFAQAYVLAHEYGHHVQNRTGTLAEIGNDRQGPGSAAVRAELQADCYAGLWMGQAVETGFLVAVTQTEINDALSAAAAVGDDRIQSSTQGSVNPETWTHGSSEQRRTWFMRGFEGGTPASCDTFSGPI